MKEFFTYEQQLEKLKKDGLVIEDDRQAINELRLEGYYNIINGYASIFKDGERFISGTTFDNVNYLYEFDKTIRSTVYKYTSIIECHVKALIAHEFSRVHGVFENEYLVPESFSSKQNTVEIVKKLIEECKNTIKHALDEKSTKYRGYIAHNFCKHGHIPMWVLIRALSFGTTSILYKNLKEEEKEKIARNFSVNAKQLVNLLEIVVAFRNIVAHGERTFCVRLPKKILSTELKIVKSLSIEKNSKGENMFGKKDFLSLLICCKYLLPNTDFAAFILEFQDALDILEKHEDKAIYKKIKIQLGLKTENWKILPKLKIN